MDNSNLLLSATRNHFKDARPYCFDYEINYPVLLEMLSLGGVARKATIYGSVGEWDRKTRKCQFDEAKKAGWAVIQHQRSMDDREKMVDCEIISDMVLDGLELMDRKEDQMILVSGDGDFVPAVNKLRLRGVPVAVAFWNFDVHKMLRDKGHFVDLTPHLRRIVKPRVNFYRPSRNPGTSAEALQA
ncbi:NYN domain-containing protein [Arenimonas sp. MALMAid1274]|uniref:NYN domain-containing protein n=1 Tax=Arenimonas sp. MALMAid1274 TaxID=3411630 RepID=UPI003B9E20AE